LLRSTIPQKGKDHAIFVFIDASNLWQAQKTKGRFLDYTKLVNFIEDHYKGFTHVFYYSAYPADGTRPYSIEHKHKFFTFLKKGLRFTVRKKELKRITITDGDAQRIEEKGNMDVEITIDALHHLDRYDTAILFSGDSDFLALVKYLRSHDKHVYVFSSHNNVSKELRTGADGYVDILMCGEDIWGKEITRRHDTKG